MSFAPLKLVCVATLSSTIFSCSNVGCSGKPSNAFAVISETVSMAVSSQAASRWNRIQNFLTQDLRIEFLMHGFGLVRRQIWLEKEKRIEPGQVFHNVDTLLEKGE